MNAGSDTVSAFGVAADGTLDRGQVSSGGDRPISVTVRDGRGYVLNATSLSVGSFEYGARGITESGAAADRSARAPPARAGVDHPGR